MKRNVWQDMADGTGNSQPGEEITTAEQFFRAVLRTLIIPLAVLAAVFVAFLGIVLISGLGLISGPFGNYNGSMALVFLVVATGALFWFLNSIGRGGNGNENP